MPFAGEGLRPLECSSQITHDFNVLLSRVGPYSRRERGTGASTLAVAFQADGWASRGLRELIPLALCLSELLAWTRGPPLHQIRVPSQCCLPLSSLTQQCLGCWSPTCAPASGKMPQSALAGNPRVGKTCGVRGKGLIVTPTEVWRVSL